MCLCAFAPLCLMFTIPYPKIQEINDNEYRVIRKYRAVLPNNDMIEVKAGFVYDGASIPRLFWSLIGSPFTGTHTRAAFIHDALYAAESYDRKICDWIFLQILQKHGCSWIKRNTLWLAVRIFGGFVWKKHTEKSVAKARRVVAVSKEMRNLNQLTQT